MIRDVDFSWFKRKPLKKNLDHLSFDDCKILLYIIFCILL